MRKTLLALLLCTVGGMAHAEVQLKDNHPERYTVVRGDTLWDISGKFLSKPWNWPKIWHNNPQVKNPHLIYPGDVLTLVYINGEPRIMVNRGESRGTIKLSPNIRSTPMSEAIPVVPRENIIAFLNDNRIVENDDEFDSAPYVLAGNSERILSGAGDRIYVRGSDLEEGVSYGVFRKGKVYTDPDTGALLGINAVSTGTGKIVAVDEHSDADEEVATFEVYRTNQEISVTDRLFETEESSLPMEYVLTYPSNEIDGYIIDVPSRQVKLDNDGYQHAGPFGRNDIVTISKGADDGVEVNNLLSIYKTGETVHDQVSGQHVKVPDERAGTLLVVQVADNVSYGIVLEASRPLTILDKVKNP